MSIAKLFRLRKELRAKSRHRVITTAWVRTKNDPLPSVGVLWDVSEGGARLAVAKPETLPEEVVISLDRSDSIGTACRVVWRSQEQVGLQFIARAEPIQRLIKQAATA